MGERHSGNSARVDYQGPRPGPPPATFDDELRRWANEELAAVLAFYGAALHDLDDWMRTAKATPQGAPVVLRNLALRWGLPVERIPLPRLTHEEYERHRSG